MYAKKLEIGPLSVVKTLVSKHSFALDLSTCGFKSFTDILVAKGYRHCASNQPCSAS